VSQKVRSVLIAQAEVKFPRIINFRVSLSMHSSANEGPRIVAENNLAFSVSEECLSCPQKL
jgi:hypothetical protein